MPFGEPTNLQDLLADLVPVPQDVYQQSFVTWLRQYALYLPMVFNWLSSCGLTIDEYCQHLLEEGILDGLEVWLLCLAANVQLNIVQEDYMWSSSQQGVNFAFPTFVLTSYGFTVLCLLEDDNPEVESALPTPTAQDLRQQSKQPQGGRPLAELASTSSSSPSTVDGRRASDTDTDVDMLMTSTFPGRVLPRSPGAAKARICLVCDKEIYSGLALIAHMHAFHKDVKPFTCEKCTAPFNL